MMAVVSGEPLVNLREIAEIELFIVRRMQELTVGDHASVYQGSGVDFVGLRDWQPGDRLSSIDWAQSSLTNFSPLVTRQFDQPSSAVVMAAVDASMSTRCGVNGSLVASAIARSLAAVGLSAVFFQDQFGMIAFDHECRPLAAAPPRIGRSHVVYCVELYGQSWAREPEPTPHRDIAGAIEAQLRRTALVPVISDFLFADAHRIIRELGRLNALHDVFLVMADARFAYEMPSTSTGWVETIDVETGRTVVLSRRELRRLADRVGEWQDEVARVARDADLDLVRVGLDRWQMETTLAQFASERRLRKM
jgi:uncharacterized protein (DUF58 family)